MVMAITDMDKIIDNLPQGWGSQEARDSVVKALLIDKNMNCKRCGMVYRTAGDMEQLSIYKYRNMNDPVTMTVFLECGTRDCGHMGTYTFRPNPLIMSRQGAF